MLIAKHQKAGCCRALHKAIVYHQSADHLQEAVVLVGLPDVALPVDTHPGAKAPNRI